MNGASVGITATRRADEQAALVVALGGVPRQGPSVDIDQPAPTAVLRRIVAEVIARPPDVAVFVTGVGAGHLLVAAREAGTLAALVAVLGRARVIARGAKPRRVLREFGVRVDMTAAPAESRVIRDVLLADGVSGRRVLVQCAGAAPDAMTGALRAAGARVCEAHPYGIDVPSDARGAVGLARDAVGGGLDSLTFTSAHAVHGFVAVAERADLDVVRIGGSGTVVAAVGPVTRAALIDHGLPVHVEPATPRMGAMFHALAAALAGVRPATARLPERAA